MARRDIRSMQVVLASIVDFNHWLLYLRCVIKLKCVQKFIHIVQVSTESRWTVSGGVAGTVVGMRLNTSIVW